MSYTVFDLETSIKKSFKRKANPFDPDNYIVMAGWVRQGGKPEGAYFGRNKPPKNWFPDLLSGTTILVGHNIKFDVLHSLQDPDNYAAWRKWVAAGGMIWDTQLGEYLLEGMDRRSHMISLDELAPMYGGNVKFDEVKALWEAGIDTIDINPDILRVYLLGDDSGHGDIGNTEVCFKGQLDRARACGQVKSILLNMGSLLCTIEMELHGMAVDLAEGERKAEELALKLAELSLELNSHLPADLPFDFNWNSGQQKSAVLFGGQVKYQARVPILNDDGTQAYSQKDELAYYVDDGTLVTVSEREAQGIPYDRLFVYKSGKNAGEYKTKKIKVPDLTKPKSRLEDFYYTFPRITKPSKAWAGAKDGVYSTSADVIAALGNRDIPFLKSLSKVTSLTKDLTTYYVVTDPKTGERTGMLTLVQADGIIHHMLNHTSTVTARFSSSNPNLQNLPKGNKSDVKKLFKSRFEGGSILQSDFTALEVYVQAILTKCHQLIEDLKLGLDMHCVRVSQKEGIPYEEALLKCKGDSAKGIAPIKEWEYKRTNAKVFSFQRAYGAGAALIAESTGMPQEEVEALIAAENERYPEVEQFYEKLTATLKANSTATKAFDMHPDVPGLVCNFRQSYWRTPDNKLYKWTEGFSPEFIAKRPASRGGTPTSFSPTEIKNYPVQGTGGEWAKAAMWLAIRAFYAADNFGGKAFLVNQVHDALYVDTCEEARVQSAALLHACMEEASTFMEWYFNWEIPVPVPSDTSYGSSMYEEIGMTGDDFKHLVAANKQQLRSNYMAGYVPSFQG